MIDLLKQKNRMKILVLDNYDSFTYNLVQYIEKILGQKVDVYRNDKISLADVGRYDKIVLSPGPGIPDEAGILKALIKQYAPTKSILGVCLGHQAIGEVFGAKLLNMNKVYHGVATPVKFINGNEPIFKGLPSQINAGRYHSWLVDSNGLPECLEVTALDEGGQIMAMRHKQFDVTGVQFHPESVLTEHGEQIIRNWLEK
jgi:anthranilate synthase component II